MAIIELINGKRNVTRWVNEAGTYGTLPSTGLIPLKNCIITPNCEQVLEPVLGAADGTVTKAYEASVQDVKLSIEYNPQDWRLFVLAIGYASNNLEEPPGSDAYYTHTIALKTDKNLESFSLQSIDNHTTDIVTTYTGCKFNSFEINWNASGGGTGKFVKCTGDVWCKEVTYDDTEKTEEASPNTLGLFQSRKVVLKINNNTAKYVRLMNGSIRYDNDLDDGWYANAVVDTARSENDRQSLTLTGSITLRYTDSTDLVLWKTGAVIANTQVEFRRTATSDTCIIPLTNFWIKKAGAVTKLEGFNEMKIDWTAETSIPVVTDDRSDYYSTA